MGPPPPQPVRQRLLRQRWGFSNPSHPPNPPHSRNQALHKYRVRERRSANGQKHLPRLECALFSCLFVFNTDFAYLPPPPLPSKPWGWGPLMFSKCS